MILEILRYIYVYIKPYIYMSSMRGGDLQMIFCYLAKFLYIYIIYVYKTYMHVDVLSMYIYINIYMLCMDNMLFTF